MQTLDQVKPSFDNPAILFISRPQKGTYVTPNIAKLIQCENTDPTMVEHIVIPADLKGEDNVCLWEMGGGGKERGLAMLVGRTDGVFVEKPYFFRQHPKPNARQGMTKVWEGCSFAVGSIDQGKKVILVYKIVGFYKDENYPENPLVEAVLVGKYVAGWMGAIYNGDSTYQSLIDAMLVKLSIPDCKYTVYMNDWAFAKRDITEHIYEHAKLEFIDKDLIKKFDDIETCLWETKVYASKLMKKFSYTPVRQYLEKHEDGTYTMVMCVLPSPTSTRDTDGKETEQSFNLEKVFVVTGITANSKLPTNPVSFFRVTQGKDIPSLFKNGSTLIDNWLRYVGC